MKEKFTEHDLKVKVESDIELDHAQLLLGHSNTNTTDRVYRRKAIVVKPSHKI